MFVVVVWFFRSSSLAFLKSAYLINLKHHCLLHWVICRLSFRSYTSFFWKLLVFLCFSICSSFGRQLCQNCGWAGSEPYVRSHITEPPCLHTELKRHQKAFTPNRVMSSGSLFNFSWEINNKKYLFIKSYGVSNWQYSS